MNFTKLKGNEIKLSTEFAKKGSKLKDFRLTGKNLKDYSLEDFEGKIKILNIFPSIDTEVCAMSVRKFNEKASNLHNTLVLCISKDLPFAQARFCGAESLNNVITLSEMKTNSFGSDNGVLMLDGPLQNLFARAIIIADENNNIIYTELVSDITLEPDYQKALDYVS